MQETERHSIQATGKGGQWCLCRGLGCVVYTAWSSACGHGSSQWQFGMRWETLRKEAQIRKGEASIWIASALDTLGFGTWEENLKRRAVSKFRAARMAQWVKTCCAYLT